jgi:hypothetical protein
MVKATGISFFLCLAMTLPVACAKSKVDRTDGREPAAKLVKTEPVRQDRRHFTVASKWSARSPPKTK